MSLFGSIVAAGIASALLLATLLVGSRRRTACAARRRGSLQTHGLHTWGRVVRIFMAGAIGLVVGNACGNDGPDPEVCRLHPDHCEGGIGGFCHDDHDCAHGFCCETDNCGGGMCTYSCHTDRECPDSMACEHGTCFFLCHDSNDCARGATCEHDDTICEWD